MAEKQQYPAPPRPLLTRNPLLWFGFFGPGAVIASMTAGSGELLFPSRMGAIFGYRLLWMFPIAALLKRVMVYSSARHMVLSGAHPLERWDQTPGPRGWLPIFFFTIFIVCVPFWGSLQLGLLGSISGSIFPYGDLYFWAAVWVVVSIFLLALGGYTFLERAQMLILGLLFVCSFIAVLYIRPEWFEVFKGFLLPQLPEYPGWVLEKYTSFRDREEWLELVVAATVTGGVAADYLCYTAFLREKSWGRTSMGIASDSEIELIAQNSSHPVRLWVKAALVDTVLSMVVIVLIATCFSILGAVILQGQQLVPEKDEQLLVHQGQFLTTLSPMLLPLYQLAVFLAFFGNVYAGPEMVSRISYEYLRSRGLKPFSRKNIRRFAIAWSLLGSLGIVWLKRANPDMRLVDIITFPSIYAGFVICAFYCFVNPWVDWRFLPARLRMNRLLVLLNLVAGVVFGVIAIRAMWEETWLHFVLLPGWILGAMGIAYLIRDKYGARS